MFNQPRNFTKDVSDDVEMSTANLVVATATGLFVLVALFQIALSIGNPINHVAGINVGSGDAQTLLLVVFVALFTLIFIIMKKLKADERR